MTRWSSLNGGNCWETARTRWRSWKGYNQNRLSPDRSHRTFLLSFASVPKYVNC